MATDAEAQRAIDSFNGSDFGGRPITVNEAKPVRKNGGGAGARGGRERW